MHVPSARQGSRMPNRAYTLPQRYTYPLDPQRLAALEAPRGMLTVRLVEAKDVPRMDILGKTDCFCKCAAWPRPWDSHGMLTLSLLAVSMLHTLIH